MIGSLTALQAYGGVGAEPPPRGAPGGRPPGQAQAAGLRRSRPKGGEQDAPPPSAYRYWPVFATVSMERPASVPALPETSVRM
ncbi:hypothetical protein SAMN04489712_108213 [Thermomonospora echinospora]|uniref:Uncharacterized protein n=1 Tax=Thermomonospora echinospora TaxID=1992 RepID=A0A1H6C1D6_9ACTN|nr:hypothetical protein SAMN04489712_108213 [Thermomonospora echinospora]